VFQVFELSSNLGRTDFFFLSNPEKTLGRILYHIDSHG
jgi:hypothetical protein